MKYDFSGYATRNNIKCSDGRVIMRDAFKYMTVTQISQMVDSLSRNEVLTGNEFRTALGFKPSEEPSADELRNKNLIDPNADYGSESNEDYYPDDTSDAENQNGSYQ